MILFYSILTCVGDDHDFFFHAIFFFFYELFTNIFFFPFITFTAYNDPPSFISYTHQPISRSFISHSLVCIIPIHCGTWIEFRDHIRLLLLLLFYRLRLDMRIITTTWTSIERTNKPPIVHDIKWNVAYTLAAC